MHCGAGHLRQAAVCRLYYRYASSCSNNCRRSSILCIHVAIPAIRVHLTGTQHAGTMNTSPLAS